MTEDKAITYTLGLMIAIIGYFVKGLVSDIKHLKLNDSKQDKEIAVIQANHENLNKSVEKLESSVKELNLSIRELINKMPKL